MKINFINQDTINLFSVFTTDNKVRPTLSGIHIREGYYCATDSFKAIRVPIVLEGMTEEHKLLHTQYSVSFEPFFAYMEQATLVPFDTKHFMESYKKFKNVERLQVAFYPSSCEWIVSLDGTVSDVSPFLSDDTHHAVKEKTVFNAHLLADFLSVINKHKKCVVTAGIANKMVFFKVFTDTMSGIEILAMSNK